PASPSTSASTTSTGSLTFKASGTVTEVPPGFNVLAGVRVEVVSGPGRHEPVTTDGGGIYDFGTLPNGNYTFKASRDGYQDLTKSVLLNRTMNNIDILLYPVPPPGATARCKDKSWSYAANKDTACMPRNG